MGSATTAERSHDPATNPLLPPSSPPPLPATYGIPAPFQDPPTLTTYVLLPWYRRRRRPRHCCRSFLSSSSLLTLFFVLAFLALSLFFLWPSDPELRVVRLRLDKIRVRTLPAPRLDIAIGLEIKIRNRDFFALDYTSLKVAVGYRGRQLGFVTSDGGHVKARGVSYADAELRLNGIQLIEDVIYLIEDLAKGSIPFDTVTEVEGTLHFFFFDIPIQGKISCEVNVNPANQTIVHQDCYPE